MTVIVEREPFPVEEIQTDVHHGGVKSPSALLVDFGKRRLYPKGGAVWSVGRHRFNDVRHADDPRFDLDLLPHQPPRVAASVDALVVL